MRVRVAEALERVGLRPGRAVHRQVPDRPLRRAEAAGRDRAGDHPRADVLIADEPVSMLDMSVRAKILELMIELKRELDLTYVYITHDLATAKFFCDRIAIMYLGKIVEIGPAERDLRRTRSTRTRSRCCGRSPSPTPTRSVAARPAARRGARRGDARRSAARSTRAVRAPSRSAAGRAGTCARCSRRAGPGCREPEYRAEREVIGTSTKWTSRRPARGSSRPRATPAAEVAEIIERLPRPTPPMTRSGRAWRPSTPRGRPSDPLPRGDRAARRPGGPVPAPVPPLRRGRPRGRTARRGRAVTVGRSSIS